jgi:hypothetical protein
VTGAPDPDDRLGDLDDERRERRTLWPYDIMVICLLAICMAILIGVSAGVVWLRVFGTA